MESANGLLNFKFSTASMQQAAMGIIPLALIQQNEVRIEKLKGIIEEVGGNPGPMPPVMLIPQVFRKFKALVGKNEFESIDHFDKRELRTLTYSLSYSENNQGPIFKNLNELSQVFKILEAGWRESYLIGLLDCYLRNWGSNSESSENLGKYVFGKLKHYNGGRAILKSLQNNIKFFDERNGDLSLGSELAIKRKSIREAAKYLSLPDGWFVYPFFSKVMVAYYEKRKEDISEVFDELEAALTVHQIGKRTAEEDIKKTSKRLISKIIIQVDNNRFAVLQDKTKTLAFKLIGDPSIPSNWSIFEGATETEKYEIFKARTILNEWITRQFINVFFEKCIDDPRRKGFWLRYASKISSFKVYGSKYTRQVLKSDRRIQEYVDARFGTVDSNRDISAFIIYIGDYLLIEFSIEGYAFYAYKQNGADTPNLKQRIANVDELRNGSMPMLVTRKYEEITDYNAEGRLFHKDGNFQNGSIMKWEDVFDWWIKKYIKVNV